MNLTVKLCSLYPIMCNCYIGKADNGEAFVVDPGIFDRRLDKALENEGIKELKYILLTHGHFDHILGAKKLQKKYGGEIAVHELDAPCLRDPQENRAAYFGLLSPSFEHDIALRDGDRLPFADGEIEVMHTPGHTKGSVCYKIADSIFSGDTLFHLCVGRTDFPGGSIKEMTDSMKKLKAVEGNFSVYPGHDETTDLDYEKEHNPYMKGI